MRTSPSPRRSPGAREQPQLARADLATGTASGINADDEARGLGSLLGRYPGDYYDGDDDQATQAHPWALCTCSFAELYCRVAASGSSTGKVPLDADSSLFFAQIGVDEHAASGDVASALRDAGDRMLEAVIFHIDHLELSEQFDRDTGFEKSVSNLTWSYAAFLSAVRARNGRA